MMLSQLVMCLQLLLLEVGVLTYGALEQLCRSKASVSSSISMDLRLSREYVEVCKLPHGFNCSWTMRSVMQ